MREIYRASEATVPYLALSEYKGYKSIERCIQLLTYFILTENCIVYSKHMNKCKEY